ECARPKPAIYTGDLLHVNRVTLNTKYSIYARVEGARSRRSPVRLHAYVDKVGWAVEANVVFENRFSRPQNVFAQHSRCVGHIHNNANRWNTVQVVRVCARGSV